MYRISADISDIRIFLLPKKIGRRRRSQKSHISRILKSTLFSFMLKVSHADGCWCGVSWTRFQGHSCTHQLTHSRGLLVGEQSPLQEQLDVQEALSVQVQHSVTVFL